MQEYDVTTPRPEYPRPQFRRERWLNLNGQWEFEVGEPSGAAVLPDRRLHDEILVPFCPESVASGIGNTDFMELVFYRRVVRIPSDWPGERVLLHIGASDHDTTVWVDGREVARHRGGFTPITADLGDAPWPGAEILIEIAVRDRRDRVQARGKQATWQENSGAHYTRTTGIWQTVWLEPVPMTYMKRPHVTGHADGSVTVKVPLGGSPVAGTVRAVVSDGGAECAQASVSLGQRLTPTLEMTVAERDLKLWEPGRPFLYDLVIEVCDDHGTVIDRYESYVGLRSLAIDGDRFLINGKPVFQRLILDQGYWQDTIMTAPSAEALMTDIRLAQEAGFNGARLHQKVFEELYLHYADLEGFLIWGEFGDWGAHVQGVGPEAQQPTASFITQWLEVLDRDISHPSIIGWCPLNETYAERGEGLTQLDDVTWGMYLATKLVDPFRPVLDTSGYAHRVPGADVYDSHSYEQDPATFARQMEGLKDGQPFLNHGPDGETWSVPYAGQPYFCSEFGGIWWDPEALEAEGKDRTESWGYGDRVRSEEEWHERFAGLFEVLVQNPSMFGLCYTQLTDVFQERNGIYRFDRSAKFPIERVRSVVEARAEYERDG